MLKILGIKIFHDSRQAFVESVLSQCASHKPTEKTKIITATSAHGLVSAQKNPKFKKILNSAYANLPDGMPLVWLGRLKGARTIERCYGPDFFKDLMIASAEYNRIRHFLMGGKPGVADKLRHSCAAKFGNRHIAGTFSPPFRDMKDGELSSLAKEISRKQVDIIWIGLSTPKQEKVAYRLAKYTQASFIITVGAAFDFHIDTVKQAPRLLQNMGLEWFYRLTREPQRLWRRYLYVVPRFLIYAIFDLRKHFLKQ